MFTLDQLLSSVPTAATLLVFLFTALFQGWLDRGKLMTLSTATLLFGLSVGVPCI